MPEMARHDGNFILGVLAVMQCQARAAGENILPKTTRGTRFKIRKVHTQKGSKRIPINLCAKRCTIRESNPGQLLGRQLCYHYTNGAGCCTNQTPRHIQLLMHVPYPNITFIPHLHCLSQAIHTSFCTKQHNILL